MIAVLSDTHMPKGGRALPERAVELLGEAEAALHGGDFFTIATLREIEALCPGPLHAVHGNVDEGELRAALPETLEVESGGARIAMILPDSGERYISLPWFAPSGNGNR